MGWYEYFKHLIKNIIIAKKSINKKHYHDILAHIIHGITGIKIPHKHIMK